MTISDVVLLFGLPIVAILAYALLCNRLMHIAQPLHAYMADRGEKLLAEDRLPSFHAKQTRFVLDHAFNGWMPWLIVILAPIAAILYLGRWNREPPLDDEDLSDRYNRVQTVAVISVFAHSPMAAVLFVIELIIMILLTFQIGVVTTTVQSLISQIEKQTAFRHRSA